MDEKKAALLFLVPSFLFLILFYYYPVFSAVQHSFYQWDGVHQKFIGMQNFVRMFQDEWFINSLSNIVILLIVRLGLSLIAPLSAAILISRVYKSRLRYWYRVAFVIPMVVTFIVLILLWQFMYDARMGLINNLLNSMGLGFLTQNWLGNPDTALFAIAFLGAPWITSFNYGLYFLVYSAGCDNIPASLHESAMIDGASSLGRFWYIDLPMLRGQIKIVVILVIINTLRYFVPAIIMTKGGPGTSTMLPGMVMYYNGFKFGNMGYASAIGFVLFVIIFLLSWINMKYLRAREQF